MSNVFNAMKFQLPEEIVSIYALQSLVFIDIETTGFSAKHHQIINIGLLYYDDQWRFTQYWASNMDEEHDMLLQFSKFDLPNTLYICYNGKTFDIPFILKRLAFHNLPPIALRHRVLDYISLGRSFSNAKQLNSYSFKSLELYFGLNRVDDVAGEEVIHAFNAFLTTSDPVHKDAILKHNERDVMHMPYILSQLSLELGPQLTQIIPIIFRLRSYIIALNLRYDKEQFILSGHITPETPLPLEVVAGVEFSIHKSQILIKLPLIKHYAGNHFFLRLDWDQCSESQLTYESLAMSDKTKLVFEIDGFLQINTLIDYLKITLEPWIH